MESTWLARVRRWHNENTRTHLFTFCKYIYSIVWMKFLYWPDEVNICLFLALYIMSLVVCTRTLSLEVGQFKTLFFLFIFYFLYQGHFALTFTICINESSYIYMYIYYITIIYLYIYMLIVYSTLLCYFVSDCPFVDLVRALCVCVCVCVCV